MTRRAAAVVAALTFTLAGCSDPRPGAAPSTTTIPATTNPARDPSVRALLGDDDVARLVPEVVATVAHDTEAFTQGLEELDGVLLESTGRYGRSQRRRLDPATGEVLAAEALPAEHFGEGLTVVGDRLIQLTWREGTAHVADATTLASLGTFTYDGEGWGLCHDGERLVMSDGSASLRFRDPETFAQTGSVEVTLDGEPVALLNELECSDGVVWANVWGATEIVAVDPADGRVRAVVDASALVPEGLGADAVLNGIARRPDSDRFWLTGKEWPVVYEVELVPLDRY